MKTKQAILDQVRTIFSEQMGIPPEKIDETSQISDMGLDSLDGVEIVMELEEEFDVSINDDEAVACATVGDLVTLIERQEP